MGCFYLLVILLSEVEVGKKLMTRFINCVAACIVIWFFLDVKKGRAQAIAFSIEERGQTAETRAAKSEGEGVKA
jgi:hypothetical protein